jgi:hypothetical protein
VLACGVCNHWVFPVSEHTSHLTDSQWYSDNWDISNNMIRLLLSGFVLYQVAFSYSASITTECTTEFYDDDEYTGRSAGTEKKYCTDHEASPGLLSGGGSSLILIHFYIPWSQSIERIF